MSKYNAIAKFHTPSSHKYKLMGAIWDENGWITAFSGSLADVLLMGMPCICLLHIGISQGGVNLWVSQKNLHLLGGHPLVNCPCCHCTAESLFTLINFFTRFFFSFLFSCSWKTSWRTISNFSICLGSNSSFILFLTAVIISTFIHCSFVAVSAAQKRGLNRPSP